MGKSKIGFQCVLELEPNFEAALENGFRMKESNSRNMRSMALRSNVKLPNRFSIRLEPSSSAHFFIRPNQP
jgi:hypothetical protein